MLSLLFLGVALQQAKTVLDLHYDYSVAAALVMSRPRE